MSVLSVSFPASGTLLAPMPTCASCLSDSSYTSRPLNRLSCSIEALQTPHHTLTCTVLMLVACPLDVSARGCIPRRSQFRSRSNQEHSLSSLGLSRSIPLPSRLSSQPHSATPVHHSIRTYVLLLASKYFTAPTSLAHPAPMA